MTVQALSLRALHYRMGLWNCSHVAGGELGMVQWSCVAWRALPYSNGRKEWRLVLMDIVRLLFGDSLRASAECMMPYGVSCRPVAPKVRGQ